MAKRHRRTKAEMIAARAAEIAKKFHKKIDKKLEENPQVIGMRPVNYQVTDPNDPNQYEFCEFIGTEQKCVEFMETHPMYDFTGKIPYLYEAENYRVTYWKKK